MADFRQLALDFVLEDDEAKLTGLAQRAAKGMSCWAVNLRVTGNRKLANIFSCFRTREHSWIQSCCSVGGGCAAMDAREQGD